MESHAPSLVIAIAHWVVSALALLITSKLISRFIVKGFWAAMWAAVVIGIANAVIWPILFLLTLPITILTLGLFTFVVNAAVLKISAGLLPGFDINGWGAAILGSIVLSITNTVLHYLLV